MSKICDLFPENTLQIKNMHLMVDNDMRLVMICKTDTQSWKLEFDNVSALTIRTLNFPAIISGFEIIDNLCRGWADDVRYTVRDYEEGLLSFHCQEVRFSKIAEEDE